MDEIVKLRADISFAERWLIDRWRTVLWRAWSLRLSLFWGAVCGLYSAWGAFQYVLPPVIFALCSMGMCAAIFAARITRQQGL